MTDRTDNFFFRFLNNSIQILVLLRNSSNDGHTKIFYYFSKLCMTKQFSQIGLPV